MLVLYVQVTLGPAHIARIKALDAQPGVTCRGLQLASTERTRDYELGPDIAPWITVLTAGEYETVGGLRIVRAALAHLRQVEPAVIILDAASDWRQVLIGMLARRRGVRVFFRWASTFEDAPRQRWRERAKRLVYGGWDGYLATGERACHYIRSMQVPEQRIHACGNPVDVDTISKLLSAEPPPPREPWLLFVGRFMPHKNLVSFVRAYARYRRAGGRLGLRIVGFGELEPEIRRAADGAPDVTFEGSLQLDAIVRLYRRAAALVLPSISEPWGLVVNEAMHVGTPVLVSTRCGCFPELIRDGETGLGMDPSDEDAMAQTLHRFESLSVSERERIGAAGRALAASQSPEGWAERVAQALPRRTE